MRRRAAIVASFASLFVAGLLLSAFGGSPSPPLVSERVLLLGESGHVVEGRVGDVIDVQLGEGSTGGWRFDSTSVDVQVTPVSPASMPQACPPSGGATGRETANAGAAYASFVTSTSAQSPAPTPSAAATRDCTPGAGALARGVRLLRLTLVAPGVATVRGWRVTRGTTTLPDVPDFVFIVLVRR